MDIDNDRLSYASLPPHLAGATFDNFDRRRNAASRVAWGYAMNFAEQKLGPDIHFLTLASPKHGTDKTHLASAIVNHRISHPELGAAKFVNVADMLDYIGKGYEHSPATWSDRCVEFRDAPCLVLDNLEVEYVESEDVWEPGDLWPSEMDDPMWGPAELFELIDYRYSNCLETVMITNSDWLHAEDSHASSPMTKSMAYKIASAPSSCYVP